MPYCLQFRLALEQAKEPLNVCDCVCVWLMGGGGWAGCRRGQSLAASEDLTPPSILVSLPPPGYRSLLPG